MRRLNCGESGLWCDDDNVASLPPHCRHRTSFVSNVEAACRIPFALHIHENAMPKIASADTHASTVSGSRLASQRLASIARGRPTKVTRLSIRAQRFLLPGIVAVLCVSLGWTIWLIVLTVFPNDTVNFVMGTREFDGGIFWAIIEPPTSVVALGVTGLAIVLAGYLFVGLKVVLWGKHAIAPSQFLATAMNLSSLIQLNLPRRSTQTVALPEAVPSDPPMQLITKENSKKTISNTLIVIATDLRHENTLIRKYAVSSLGNAAASQYLSHLVCCVQNVCVKIGNLLAQFVVLYITLEAGYPRILVVALTAVIALNSLACAAIIYSPWRLSRLLEDLVDFM
ncbi:hypothetical protein BBJ28_00000629 [Nothophytophthora sp. Chile5]|nr:hypothetical protein BBJ28_00000629 [Nothophytophthora sp. Chile5]